MRARWIRFVLITAVGMAPLMLAPAWADCGAPRFVVETEAASPGEVVRFSGEDFFAECNDTPGPCQRGGVSGPLKGIQIVLAQGSTAYPVATVDAGEDFAFSGSFHIPDLPPSEGAVFSPGPAQVVAVGEGQVWTRQLMIEP